MHRRHFLVSVAVAGPFGLAGCIGDFDPEDHLDDWQEESHRGEAEGVVFERSVEDVPGEALCETMEIREIWREFTLDHFDGMDGVRFSGRRDSDRFRVSRTIIVTRDGDPQSVPDVAFEEVLSATPRSATFRLYDEDSNEIESCEWPVYVRDRYIQQE